MGQFKQLHLMLEKGASDSQIAYYLFNNTKIGNWSQAKQIAKKLRNEYEHENNENGNTVDETEE
jgi:hypothetical protein